MRTKGSLDRDRKGRAEQAEGMAGAKGRRMCEHRTRRERALHGWSMGRAPRRGPVGLGLG